MTAKSCARSASICRGSGLSSSCLAPCSRRSRGSSSRRSGASARIWASMLVLWLVLATVPLWIARAGLYPYLGIEILIWSLYALAFNLVLGTAGLPSFGHGAYFGIGAYAFGLCQFEIIANLWICLLAAAAVAGLAGALVALIISHRRGIYYAFMTI